MDPSIIRNKRIEEAEEVVVTWGKSDFVGKKFENCPNWYLKFIAEHFSGRVGELADILYQWREENGVEYIPSFGDVHENS